MDFHSPPMETVDERTPLVTFEDPELDHHYGFLDEDDEASISSKESESDGTGSGSRDRRVSFDNSLGDISHERALHRGHRRDESHGSVLDYTIETFSEMRSTFVETVISVRDHVVEAVEELHEVMDEEILPVKPREEGDHSQKLSAVALAVLVFYKVSGGPFGCEPAVKAGGPFVALMAFIIFPFVWCIPEALMTAELGSAFPEPSGAVAWVEEAFGSKAGLLSGYFHWVSGATDNAIYPSLFLKYIAAYLHQEDLLSNNLIRFVFAIFITAILSFVNYTGLEIVGKLSIAVSIISMAPFLIMCILAIPKLDASRWLVMPAEGIAPDDDHSPGFFPDPVYGGIMWRPLLNMLFWNLNSFDVGASFAGEVRDPERVFPRAMFLSIVLVVLGYILPLGASLGAVDTYQGDWDAGYFTNVSVAIGGNWLGILTVFAAAISNIALYEAEMSGDAYQLLGMGERGMIPKVFTKRSRFGTPVNGIILNTLTICAMSVADFDALVEMLNFAYALSLQMEFAAFIKLRITQPDVERPYKIPLNTFGCILFVTPPVLFLFVLMAVASKVTYLYLLCLSLFGIGFHFLQKFAKHYHFLEYVEAPVRKKSSLYGSA